MNVVVCSTVYPAVLPYVDAFLSSIRGQIGPPFKLHLALDAVSPHQLGGTAGLDVEYSFAAAGDTPAQVRERAWERICYRFDVAVLVDADDMLYPTRVAAAVRALEHADIYACSLDLVNAEGDTLDLRFNPSGLGEPTNWGREIAFKNVFGLSNTAYRTPFLEAALPLPADIEAVDWFVVTLAIAAGARLTFDEASHMAYRQHGTNLGRVTPPFDLDFLRRATALVRRHHGRILGRWPDTNPSPGKGCFERRAREVAAFAKAIEQVAAGQRYLDALNALERSIYAWWEMIAMPELEHTWNR